jgi:hypothetical protein
VQPVGDFNASWSKVKHWPPTAKILVLAASVNLSAQTVILGTTNNLSSSTTLQTQTMVFPALFWEVFTILLMEIG